MKQQKLSQKLLFSARLRELMARDNLTQQQLASATGISQSAISQHLNGLRAAPGVEEAVAIASHFKVTIDWLLGVDPSSLNPSVDPDTESHARRDAELERVATALEEQTAKLRKILAVGKKGRTNRRQRMTES